VTSFLRLDCGEALEASALRQLPADATLALRVTRPEPPLREGQIVHVRPCRSSDARGLGLTPEGHLSVTRDGTEIVARVTAIERGPVRLDVDTTVVRWLPGRWLPPLADALEVAGRVTRPLTPPLYLGDPDACLGEIRDKYSRASEVRRYATLASGELERLELELVSAALGRGGRLLDVGCGAGREALGLARAGYRVVGIDLSATMIAAAREAAARAGLAIEFRVQSLTELADPPGSYDGAYIAAALHHVPGRARRVDALRRVWRALVPGGALLVFVVYRARRPLLSRSRLVDRLRWLARKLPVEIAVSEPGDGYMREVSEASDPRAPIFFHDYADSREVRDELVAAGFVPHEPHPGWWSCRRAE
jgi:SAM-dependent methyltransferase